MDSGISRSGHAHLRRQSNIAAEIGLVITRDAAVIARLLGESQTES
jgi:hypothetical protein